MRVVLGTKKKVKLNTFELLEAIEAPEIAEIFFHKLEAVKSSYHEVILELRRKKKEAMREGKKDQETSNSNIISISDIKQVYITDPRILRLIEDLNSDEEYRESLLKEHIALYKKGSFQKD